MVLPQAIPKLMTHGTHPKNNLTPERGKQSCRNRWWFTATTSIKTPFPNGYGNNLAPLNRILENDDCTKRSPVTP